jgi:hypothetical protein
MVNARRPRARCRTAPGLKQGCLSGSRLRRGSSSLQRKNGSLVRRSPGYVAFVCRARQSIVDIVQATILPAWFRPVEPHGSLSLQWLTTRLMFPRIGPAAQLASRAIASLTGEDHLPNSRFSSRHGQSAIRGNIQSSSITGRSTLSPSHVAACRN